MGLPRVGPVVAARVLADVGDGARFADCNRFASWTSTAPIEASSGEIVRRGLSRSGNPRMNHMIHIAAATQIRLETPRPRYYRRKLAAKTRGEAMRCLKRRISDASSSSTPQPTGAIRWTRVREGTAGRLKNPARPARTRIPALRSSHFPDPRKRRYNRLASHGSPPTPAPLFGHQLTTKGSRKVHHADRGMREFVGGRRGRRPQAGSPG